DADIVLLHAHDRPGFAHPELSQEMVGRIERLVEQAAQKSLADLAAEAGAARTLFRNGDPAMVILEAAEELHPAMVVMGTPGRRGFNRLAGSVAVHVVRGCPVPVMTVRSTPGDEN